MTTILINLNCLGDFENDKINSKVRPIIDAWSEHFAVVAFSTWHKEAERHEILQWLVDNSFSVEDLLLRPDGDYSKSVETIFDLIETNFRKPEEEIHLIVESDQRIVEALFEEGYMVWEAI